MKVLKDKVEIERKFLLDFEWRNLFKDYTFSKIEQGYMCDRVRIRTQGMKGFITIKDKSTLSRMEYEYEIPFVEAVKLIKMCDHKIKKIRYEVFDYKIKKYCFIDVFKDDNDGLVIAEIEFDDMIEINKTPDWVGIDVTRDLKC